MTCASTYRQRIASHSPQHTVESLASYLSQDEIVSASFISTNHGKPLTSPQGSPDERHQPGIHMNTDEAQECKPVGEKPTLCPDRLSVATPTASNANSVSRYQPIVSTSTLLISRLKQKSNQMRSMRIMTTCTLFLFVLSVSTSFQMGICVMAIPHSSASGFASLKKNGMRRERFYSRYRRRAAFREDVEYVETLFSLDSNSTSLFSPTKIPTMAPSTSPTAHSTSAPSITASSPPTNIPSPFPSLSKSPSMQPSTKPTNVPSSIPTIACVDDPTFTFLNNNSKEKGCIFISEREKFFFCDELEIRNACRLSCGNCAPSDPPSVAPTVSPSISLAPTTPPSTQPSSSTKPTNQPSSSTKPTNVPTMLPSSAPSMIPSTSSAPSMIPSTLPSTEPSTTPESNPSVVPSVVPTDVPTLNPSVVPTSSPSSKPSLSPSLDPSSTPSLDPSSTPSTMPSAVPSSIPTISYKPSAYPSSSPSNKPTSTPTAQPSLHPSVHPSDKPSSTPSAAPTLSLQKFSFEVEVTFDECETLEPVAKQILEVETKETFENELWSLQRDVLESLRVIADVVNQVPVLDGDLVQNTTDSGSDSDDDMVVNGTSNATGISRKVSRNFVSGERGRSGMDEIWDLILSPSNNWRHLQNDDMPGLKVILNLYVELRAYRIFSKDDIQKSLGKTFNTLNKRENYILNLQRSGDSSFSRINTVEVSINGVISKDIPPVKEDDPEVISSKGTNWTVIIGSISGAGFVAIALGTFIFYRKSRRNRNEYTPQSEQDLGISPQGFNPSVTSVIEVNEEQDISTIGEPEGASPGMFNPIYQRDDTDASSYDYKLAYAGAGDTPSVSTAGGTKSIEGFQPYTQSKSEPDSAFPRMNSMNSKMSGLGTAVKDEVSYFADDTSFERMYGEEERIEIVAPAGKLGVVIDTPIAGVPLVHAIKDSSVLADQVRIGDRLISVDGEDVTDMTAIKVSKIISSKASNPRRTLVFLRTQSHG